MSVITLGDSLLDMRSPTESGLNNFLKIFPKDGT